MEQLEGPPPHLEMPADRDSYFGRASFFSREPVEEADRDAVDAGLTSDGRGQRGRIALAVGLLSAVSIIAAVLVAELVEQAPRFSHASELDSRVRTLPVDARASR